MFSLGKTWKCFVGCFEYLAEYLVRGINVCGLNNGLVLNCSVSGVDVFCAINVNGEFYPVLGGVFLMFSKDRTVLGVDLLC